MKDMYQFCFTDRRGDRVAGVVKATSPEEAKKILTERYGRDDISRYCRIEPVKFNDSGVCVVYYG